MFPSREDSIKKTNGRIISTINKTINNRDAGSLSELKKLIDRLRDLIAE